MSAATAGADGAVGARWTGLVVVDKEAGLDVPRRGGPVPADLRPAPGGPCRDARPRRHRRAAGRAWAGPPACCGSSPRSPKTYEAEVVLGTATSTLDASGRGRPAPGTWRGHPGRGAGGRRGPSPAPSSRCRRWCRRVKVGGRRLHDAGPGRASRSSGPPAGDACTGSTSTPTSTPAPRGAAGSRSSARRAPTSGAGRRPGPGARRRGPPAEPAADPRRVVHRRRRPARSTSSAPRRAHPGPGPARPRPGASCRRPWPTWWPGVCPSTGCPLGVTGRRSLGPGRRAQHAAGRLRGHRDRPDPPGRGPARALIAAPRGPGGPPPVAALTSRLMEVVPARPVRPAGRGVGGHHRCLRRRPPRPRALLASCRRPRRRRRSRPRWSPSTAIRPRWCARTRRPGCC